MKEQRCPECKKLLFKGDFTGRIEIKCPKCKNILVIDNKK